MQLDDQYAAQWVADRRRTINERRKRRMVSRIAANVYVLICVVAVCLALCIRW